MIVNMYNHGSGTTCTYMYGELRGTRKDSLGMIGSIEDVEALK